MVSGGNICQNYEPFKRHKGYNGLCRCVIPASYDATCDRALTENDDVYPFMQNDLSLDTEHDSSVPLQLNFFTSTVYTQYHYE